MTNETRDDYDFRRIESRWQKHWDDSGLFRRTTTPDPKRPYYCLMMFPYPSGTLHMGHVINYSIGDVLVRSRLMQGYDVLSPMGWDAFGLPAENAAIKSGVHPTDFTRANIDKMREQMKKAGWGYDWEREVATSHPGYYKWTQWVFLQLQKRGLAVRKKAPVNWCETDQTVLANEQVIDGRCERCGGVVDQRDMTQWFFTMSRYAQRLLDDHAKLRGKWPDRVINNQENWIGRSEGARIHFAVDGTKDVLTCFTTRPDTLFGVTFFSIAPEHPMVEELVKGTAREKPVMEKVREMRRQSAIDRAAEETEKVGIDTGRFVVNPADGRKVPIFVANYVLMTYGTGAVMGVPAHDQRDFLFAKKHGLEIRVVIQPEGDALDGTSMKAAYPGDGRQVNSGRFDGLANSEGKKRIVEHLAKEKKGEGTVQYALRDWLLSRQRYWGAPIPMIHCDACGEVPVPEKDLPVLLPRDIQDFSPKGKSPLAAVDAFVKTTCPKCGKAARRETDTMDTFVDSSWYFLRYLTPRDEARAWDPDLVRSWMPVHQYVGGSEHSNMHLVYCRFLFKALFDAGLVPIDEPAERLFCQGMVCKTAHRCPEHGWLKEDEVADGKHEACGTPVESAVHKMSKSKLNVTSPDTILEMSGADVLRVSILTAGPPDQDLLYSDDSVIGAKRYLGRLWETLAGALPGLPPPGTDPASGKGKDDRAVRRKTHQTIARVTEAVNRTFGFNTAISGTMELLNTIRAASDVSGPVLREAFENLVLCLSPFAPHLAEELWERLGHGPSVFQHPWPTFDPSIAAEDEVEIVFQVNGKVRGKRAFPVGTANADLERAALADDKVKEALAGAAPAKVIVVPGKLVNVVVKK